MNVYSLENLIFERHGVNAVSEICLPGHDDVAAHAVAGYDDILSDLNNHLSYLYIVHAIAHRMGVTSHKFRIESPSVSDSHTSRVIRANRALCRKKTLELIRILIAEKGYRRYNLARRSVFDNISSKGIRGEHFVPGKEFHLKYLVGRIGLHGGSCLPQRTVVAYAAEKCTFANDPRLARRLRRVAKAP
ncbi:hypothetical protein D3C85_1228560 [compost metagenome]